MYTKKQRHQDLLDVISCARSTDNLSAYDEAMGPISRLISDSSEDSQADGHKDIPVHRSYTLNDEQVLAMRKVVGYLYDDEVEHYNSNPKIEEHIFDSVDVLFEWLRDNTEDV